jgi:hypothetical protein
MNQHLKAENKMFTADEKKYILHTPALSTDERTLKQMLIKRCSLQTKGK